MKVVVCVKQVPDLEGKAIFEKGEISTQDLTSNTMINPLDLLAMEEALQIRENAGQGHVTLISVGNSLTEESLRRGIAMGADEAILLCDPALDNGDSYTIALVLAKTISTIPYDLVLCGQRAYDTRAGQVGAFIAQRLDIPMVQGVIDISRDSEAGKLVVHRKLKLGDREVVECSPPVLLTVETGLNTPRHLTVPGIFKAKKKEIIKRDLRQLGLSPEAVGLSGSKVRITHITPPKPKMKGLVIPDSKLSPAERLRLIAGGGLARRETGYLEGDPRDMASKIIEYFRQQRIIPG